MREMVKFRLELFAFIFRLVWLVFELSRHKLTGNNSNNTFYPKHCILYIISNAYHKNIHSLTLD